MRFVLLLNIFMKMSGHTVAVTGYSYNSILKVRNETQRHLVCLIVNIEMDKSLIIIGMLLKKFKGI